MVDIVYTPSPQAGNPGELSSAFATMRERTALLRAVYGGTESMRAEGKNFLPQYEKESEVRYQARLASTFALNKLREAVDAASAKPFRTMLKLGNSTPDLDLWQQDIDLQGNHLHVFAHQLFNNGFLDGMSHVLVDHPDTFNMKNLAQQKESGARPFMKLYKVDDVAAAYDEYVGGDTKTVHVRIRGQRSAREGFKEVLYNQMRVIEVDPGSTKGIVQLWEQKATSGGSNWDFVEETPLEMAEVPFATFYAGEKEADYLVRPVFIDLAYKQIEHWISSSDQRSILSAARFPMLACSGVQIDPDDQTGFEIGPWKVLYAPEANGRWYYVEPKGTAIESGFKDLAALEIQMDMMALNPVTGTHRQYVPQNERDIQETRVHSVVHDMAINCQDTLERAIGFMAQWTGQDYSQVTVGLNTEFSNTKDKITEIAQLVKLWEKRGLSRPVLLDEMINRNLLSAEFNKDEEIAIWAKVDELIASGELTSNPGAGTSTSSEGGDADPAGDNTDGNGSAAKTFDFPNGQSRPKREI